MSTAGLERRLRHQRSTPPDEKQETTPLELFFDLVFVFAVTQLSHLLLDHLTWEGAAQTLFLLLVVWWAWTYTTVDQLVRPRVVDSVRLVLILDAASLMSIAIPDAFGERARCSPGLCRTAGRALRLGDLPPAGVRQRRLFQRITSWAVAAGVCGSPPWSTPGADRDLALGCSSTSPVRRRY